MLWELSLPEIGANNKCGVRAQLLGPIRQEGRISQINSPSRLKDRE